MPEKKASVSFDALMRQLKNGEYAPVYLLMGDEPYYIDKLSNFFQNKILTPEQQAFDLTVVFGADVNAAQIADLAMQYPKEIAGVTNSDFLRAAINARLEKNISLFKFIKEIEGNIAKLKMKEDLAHRFVNDGFSGGEKKRNEILQMMMLHPSIAMLDEIDSGLDVDAIKLVSDAIHELYDSSEMGLMIVSHYERFFTMIKPTHSHVIVDGRIVVEGDDELVYKIDSDGYDWLYEELKIQPVKEERPLVYSLGTCARNPRGKNV